MNTANLRRPLAISGLVAAIGLLHLAGSTLPGPPLPVGQWWSWWLSVDPVAGAAAVLRVGAMAASLWLLLVTVVEAGASLARSERLQHLAHRAMPAVWRTVVLRPVTLGALAVPQLIVPIGIAGPAVAITAEADMNGSSHFGPTVVSDVATIEMSRRPAPIPAASTDTGEPGVRTITMSLHRPGEAETPQPDAVARPDASGASHHVVAPGENLWSIAAAHLNEARGERPTPAEVTGYWQQVIGANRDTLPDPENPDLLYQGIVIALPPVT